MKTYWVSWPLERKLNMKFVFKTGSLLRLNWLAESGFPLLRGEQPRTERSFSFVAPWRPWDGCDGHTGRLKLRLREGCPACDGWRGLTSLLVSNPRSLRSPVSEKWKCVSLSHAPFRVLDFPVMLHTLNQEFNNCSFFSPLKSCTCFPHHTVAKPSAFLYCRFSTLARTAPRFQCS